MGTTVISSFSTPTKNLSYEDSIKFYQDLLNKIKHDLDIEKQKPNFSEEEYYKKKMKEYGVENIANLGVPRHLR